MLAKGLLYCNLFEIQLKIQDLRLYYSTADQIFWTLTSDVYVSTYFEAAFS